jgi:hypothetical protein
MKLTPYAKQLSTSKEEKQKALAAPQAAEMKQKALHEISKLDVQITEKQSAIIELTAKYPLDFDALIRAQDDLALAERRKRQLGDIISELFPTK